jgi:hypothetical protein
VLRITVKCIAWSDIGPGFSAEGQPNVGRAGDVVAGAANHRNWFWMDVY